MVDSGELPQPDVFVGESQYLRHRSFEDKLDLLMDVIDAGRKALLSDPVALAAYRLRKEQSEAAWQSARRAIIEGYLRHCRGIESR